MTQKPVDKQRADDENHRRWELAREIVDENAGFWQRLLVDTRDRPATSVAMAFGLGLIIGLVVRGR